MKKVLISGGSGFIGTNLIEFLDRKNIVQLLSIDKKEPKINRHRSFWKQVDLCDKDTLKKTILDFQPNYVIHLAARTDLCWECLICLMYWI